MTDINLVLSLRIRDIIYINSYSSLGMVLFALKLDDNDR